MFHCTQEGSRAANARHPDNLQTGGDFEGATTYGGEFLQKEGARAANAKHADNLETGGQFYSKTTYGKQFVQKVRGLQDAAHVVTSRHLQHLASMH